MRRACLLLLITTSICTLLNAQNLPVLLRSGSLPAPVSTHKFIDSFNSSFSGKKVILLLRFVSVPDEKKRLALLDGGIELLTYVPHNAYTACIRKPLNRDLLKHAGVNSMFALTAREKL